MKNKNKYIQRSRLSEAKFREIVKCFSLDIEAKKASVLVSLNRNTMNRHYVLIRKRIAAYCEKVGMRLGIGICLNSGMDITNVDDCCLADGDSAVFGICLNKGKIYTEMINENELPDDRKVISSRHELECFIRDCDSTRWKDYQAVVDYVRGCYSRTGTGTEDSCQMEEFKSCDLFWGYAKSRLMKFNGLSKKMLFLHIKECEFRFNHRNDDIYKLLLKIIRESPL